jgi:hypothetical protein
MRFFRTSIVRIRFEMEASPLSQFSELRQTILTIIKKSGWALITVGRVNEYTASDAKIISADLAQADSIPEIASILMKCIRSA